MRKFTTPSSFAVSLLIAFTTAGAADLSGRKDPAGSADHPLISRYPGAVILEYAQRDYDAFRLVTGPAESADGGVAPRESLDLEGRLTRLRYAAPDGRSTLEVFRNYQAALREAGFETLFECSGDACGPMRSLVPRMGDDRGTALRGKDQRYLAARARTAEGEVFVSLLVVEHDVVAWLSGNPVVQLDLIETTAMEEGLVAVDLTAEEMARELSASGHASLYGIHFDTDSATVEAESAATLAEIAKLLAEDPDLRLFVVGHTDGRGTLGHNLDLSRRRAEAVVEALVDGHGVAAGRLAAHGVGPLAPVATNGSDDGRALNRRVELVRR